MRGSSHKDLSDAELLRSCVFVINFKRLSCELWPFLHIGQHHHHPVRSTHSVTTIVDQFSTPLLLSPQGLPNFFYRNGLWLRASYYEAKWQNCTATPQHEKGTMFITCNQNQHTCYKDVYTGTSMIGVPGHICPKR